jgi:hypothetical protein
VRSKSGDPIAQSELPAGTVFSREKLRTFTSRPFLERAFSKGGQDGKNRNILPYTSVPFQVVVFGIPDGFDPYDYDVKVKVSRWEGQAPDES